MRERSHSADDHHAEFRDPRLVEVYDAECVWGPDDDLFLALVEVAPGHRVLDLGCGTGRLTLALAATGRAVTGVDPAPASLAAARAKPGADRVTWIEGTSADLPGPAAFDGAVMTSHVAQIFVADDAWHRTLADLARALAPGATLVFDSRDPRARGWERWGAVDVTLPDGRAVAVTTEVTAVRPGDVVDFTRRYRFPDGEVLAGTATLRFRPEAELRASLDATGFEVAEIYGGWHREPPGQGDGELIVVAHRR